MYDCLDNEIIRICRYEYDYFLNKANVIGVGLGYKEIRGIETCEKVIQVFVEKKLPLNSLCKKDNIPTLYKNIKTDVIETGPCKINALTSRIRPVWGGYAIGPDGSNSSGTYGCLVTDGIRRYMLSNNHVIAESNLLPIEHPILQTSVKYGGKSPRDIVAYLSKFIPIEFITPTMMPENYVDAAIARVLPELVTPLIIGIGRPTGVTSPTLGMKIKMTGSISGYVVGEIKSVNATTTVTYPSKAKALFKDQIFYKPINFEGDSGALVLDMNGKAVALHFSGGDKYGVGNPIDLVLNALEVRLVTK